jgi:hypothetical protein
MTYNHDPQKNQQVYESTLRQQLDMLRSRYDHGAVSPAVYVVIRAIEIEISWLQHRRGQP